VKEGVYGQAPRLPSPPDFFILFSLWRADTGILRRAANARLFLLSLSSRVSFSLPSLPHRERKVNRRPAITLYFFFMLPYPYFFFFFSSLRRMQEKPEERLSPPLLSGTSPLPSLLSSMGGEIDEGKSSLLPPKTSSSLFFFSPSSESEEVERAKNVHLPFPLCHRLLFLPSFFPPLFFLAFSVRSHDGRGERYGLSFSFLPLF